MKKILFLLLFILAGVTVDAQKWYVATTGNDASGNGTALRPWLTVKHATDTITDANGFAGDTIIVGAGTFSEPAQIALSDNISLMGAGITSIITSANALDPIVLLQSNSEGTSATQSISYLKFDGNSLTAIRGVAVWRRSNVSIHHCTFEDFLSQGASFRGQTNSTGGPTIYATGNKFYNNIITNCSRYTTFGTGCLEIGGQTGMLVYNNTITVVDRGGTSHGYGIKGNADGYNKGLKIYDNEITVPEFENTGYNFSIELWSQRGGVEIYRNTLKGAIDIGGWDTYDDGGYGFALKIYENTIGYDANQTYSTSGIYLEPAVRDGIYIYRNYFKNMKYGVRFNHATGDLVPGIKDVYIYYNIFYNLREAGAGLTGFGVVSNTDAGGYVAPLSNINILNNVFYNPTAGTMSTVIWVRGLPEVSDIQIRNNIIYNTYNGITFANSTVNGLDINNNIFFNATNADILFQSTTVSDSSTTGNLTSDPQWVGGSPYSYKLQETSPARDAGTSVGLTSDYGGYSVPIGALPDIGAWEYGADVDPPNWTEQGIGWDRMQKKVNFRDTVNFTRGFMIAGVPISASGSGLEILGGLTATVNDLNNTSGSTGNLQGQINALSTGSVAEKADTSLSNLASVAINTHLLPATDGAVDLGSATYKWGNIFIDSAKVINWNNGDITATHSDQTLTFAGGNIVLPSTTSIGDVSATEISYVNGVTSAIQTQINATESRVDSIVTVLADTANIETLLQIDFDTDTVATKAYARLVGGGGSGYVSLADSSATAEPNSYATGNMLEDGLALKLNLADSSAVAEPGHYATGNMLEDGLALKANLTAVKLNVDTTGIFVFGAGSGAAADSTLFEINDSNFGSFHNYTDTLYVVNFNVLYLTSGDSLRFNCYYGNRMTGVATDSLFNAIQAVGTDQNILTPNDRKIPPNTDVWIKMSGTQLTGLRPKQFEIQLNGYTIRDH